MTSISARLFLDTRHQKKDGSYPIKLRIIINRRSFEISTGYSITAQYWNEKSMKAKTSCPIVQNVTRLNNLLQKQKTEAVEIIMQLQDKGTLNTMSLKEIKHHVKGKGATKSLYAFFDEVITDMTKSGSVGNARVYRMVRNSIQNFVGEKDFPIHHVSYRWLKQYETWYLSTTNRYGKRNTINGLAVNMRTIRALYNRAIKSKLASKDSYPFLDYKINSEKTRKRAISHEAIAKLKAIPEDQLTTRQKRAKDYFFISFYLMGASFIDMAFLRLENFINGRIEYKRRKTGRLHSIKVTQPLQELLTKYSKGKKKHDFILNVIKGDTDERQYAAARDELKRYNTALKELAEMAGITDSITSYTARHSYATIAKFKGVPIAVISEALGHESTDVTQVYLDSFDNSVLDHYNELITKKI